MTITSGQDTVLVMQEGRLLGGLVGEKVGVGLATEEVEFTPHPSIEKKDVAQSVGFCLLNMTSGQETVLVMQGGRLLGESVTVGVGEAELLLEGEMIKTGGLEDGRQLAAVK